MKQIIYVGVVLVAAVALAILAFDAQPGSVGVPGSTPQPEERPVSAEEMTVSSASGPIQRVEPTNISLDLGAAGVPPPSASGASNAAIDSEELAARIDHLSLALSNGTASYGDLLDLAVDLATLADLSDRSAGVSAVASYPLIGLPEGFTGSLRIAPEDYKLSDPFVIEVTSSDVGLTPFASPESYASQRLTLTLGTNSDAGAYFSGLSQFRLRNSLDVVAMLKSSGDSQIVGGGLVVGERASYYMPMTATAGGEADSLHVVQEAAATQPRSIALDDPRFEHLAAMNGALRAK
jgi:hypothetical protein